MLVKAIGSFIVFSLLTAVTTSLNSPFTIESLNEVSSSEEAENVRDFVEGLSEGKARGLFHGHCSVYPTSRFVRRTALDSVSKSRDEGFFANMLTSQFRIDPEQHTSEVLHATNGAHFDPETATPSQKEILLCGASAQELMEFQSQIVEYGIYPASLQLGTIANLGGLIHYSRWKKLRFPTLVLEITPKNSFIFIFNNNITAIP